MARDIQPNREFEPSPLSRALTWFEKGRVRFYALVYGILLSSPTGVIVLAEGIVHDSLLLKVIGYVLVAPGGLFIASAAIAAQWDDYLMRKSKEDDS